MTTFDPPDDLGPDADPLDELASALVDGEASADERARAGDPDVAARVAAFEAVARQVGEPVTPPPPAARDAAIAAALAAAALATSPSSLDERRRRRRLPPWVGQAAAALLVIAGLGALAVVVGNSGGDADDAASDTATEESAASDDDSGALDEAGGESGTTLPAERVPDAAEGGGSGSGGQDSAGAPTAPSSSTAFDLGTFADESALVAAARSVPPPSETADEGDEALTRVASCADRFRAGAVSAAVAVLRDRAVVVTVGEPPAREVVVLDASTCEELLADSLG